MIPKEKTTNKTRERSRDFGIISMFLIPIILFVLMERLFSNESVVLRIDSVFLYINVLFWELVLLLFFFLFNSLRVAVIVQVIIMFFFGIVNHYLMLFRGSPFQPWDIFSISTALSVSNNYSYVLKIDDIYIFMGFAMIIIWGTKLSLKPVNNPKTFSIIRTVPTFLTAIILLLFTLLLQNESLMNRANMFKKLFVQNEMVKRDGIAVTFLYDLKFLRVEKPKGYSVEKAQQLLGDASQKVDDPQINDVKPHIIVIMSETFSDLSVLGDFKTNKDVIPFVKSMLEGKDNVVSGYLRVPVLGGNTANTEFEFLTGNAMKWFDMTSVPYQQYINHKIESMASGLKAQGYRTIAIHPYGRKGWNRDRVYEYLGFDDFLSEEGFSNYEIIRDYISDKSDYDKIIEIYENIHTYSPVFIFNVTMQNHGAYFIQYDNFTPDITADGIEDIEFSQYISLLRVSDDETRRLVEYFSDSVDPILLVFFGDHQPNDTTVDELYSDRGDDVFNLSEDEKAKRYLVPFFIWANYDIPEEKGIISTTYELNAKVVELSGNSLSDYEKFIKGVENGLYSEKDYRIVQYYKVFDEKK